MRTPKKILIPAALAAFIALLTPVLIWSADWPTQSGSPQRTGWARSENTLTKQNIHLLQLLYKHQTDNQARGLNSLSSPIINGNLITYLGFKEMLVFAGTSGKVFSVDADLNKLLWEKELAASDAAASTAPCTAGMTSPVVMAGSSSSSVHFGSATGRAPIARVPPPPRPLTPPAARNRPMLMIPEFVPGVTPLTATVLNHLEVFYAVSSDGKLHLLNSYTGEELVTPMVFVPPNAKVTSLNIRDNTLYATTADECGGNPNALYALDILSPDKHVGVFTTGGSGFSGIGGTVLGDDGTVYVQVAYGSGDFAGAYNDTVLALTPKELKVRDFFTPKGKPPKKKNSTASGITPMLFRWRGKDMLLAGSSNGCVYLLDSTMLGGRDHHTPFSQTEPLANRKNKLDGYGFRGAFSSWLDVDSEIRWAYAPLWGPLDKSAVFPTNNGAVTNGGILAFKIAERSGALTMEPVWTSADILEPAPVVVANGMVLGLSSGAPQPINRKKRKNVPPSAPNHATLYALDSATGKQLYSSGNTIPTYSHASDLAVANGRIYFGGHDNAIYCFGLPTTQPQLTAQ